VSTPLAQLARRYSDWGDARGAVAARTLDALAALVSGAAASEGRAIGAAGAAWDDGVMGEVVRRVATVRHTELDDIHMLSGTTPGSVVVPTAVTVGAALDSTPAAYARAVEIGYDAMTRLGRAIDGANAVYRGLWPTYFCAPFAAAAVVASLLDLDAARMQNALGIAVTRATGLSSAVTGSPLARWLTVGDAARAGCAAALAAQHGFVADVDLGRISAGAGVEVNQATLIEAVENAIDEVSVKPFPTAKQSLAAVEASLRLRGRVAVEDISVIRVHVPGPYAAMVSNPPSANSRLSRISSVRWNVALALICPAELDDLERTVSLDDAALAKMADRVEIVADPSLEGEFPARWPARVVIADADELVVDAPGDPPGNGLDAVAAKWRRRGLACDGLTGTRPSDLDHALRS
jgi:2-methylcitrate dehydratase PrpD